MQDLNFLSAEVRVAAGAALLDLVKPNWFKEISIVNLRMNSCVACVLGQLYGEKEEEEQDADDWVSGFDLGAEQLFKHTDVWLTESEYTYQNTYLFGFNAIAAAFEWEDLRRLWVEQIKARLT